MCTLYCERLPYLTYSLQRKKHLGTWHLHADYILPSESDPHLGISLECWQSVQSVAEIELQMSHLEIKKYDT